MSRSSYKLYHNPHLQYKKTYKPPASCFVGRVLRSLPFQLHVIASVTFPSLVRIASFEDDFLRALLDLLEVNVPKPVAGRSPLPHTSADSARRADNATGPHLATTPLATPPPPIDLSHSTAAAHTATHAH